MSTLRERLSAMAIEYPLLADALTAVLDLHREGRNPYQEANSLPGACVECTKGAYWVDGMGPAVMYPCPTVKAIEAELDDEPPQEGGDN